MDILANVILAEGSERAGGHLHNSTTECGEGAVEGKKVGSRKSSDLCHWRRNIRSQQRKSGKFDRDQLGPYSIAKIEWKNFRPDF